MARERLIGSGLLGAGATATVALLAFSSSRRGRRRPTSSFKPGPRVALYWRRLQGERVRCELCFRRCVIPPGRRGFCGVRENRGGTLYTGRCKFCGRPIPGIWA